MERRKFEDSFQEAFKEAEVNPSENVWTNIELDLERSEGGKMKRRLVFFKMLAAASVIFAMSIAGIGYYMLSDKTLDENIAQQKKSKSNTTQQMPSDEDAKSSEIKEDNKNQKETLSEGTSKAQMTEKRLADNTLKSSEKNITSSDQKAEKDPTQLDKANQIAASENLKSSDKPNSHVNNKKDENSASQNEQSRSVEESTTPLITSNNVSDNKNFPIEDSESTRNSISKNNNPTEVSTATTQQEERIVTNKESLLTPPKESFTESSRQLPAFYQPKLPELQLPVSTGEIDPGALLLAKLADEEKAYANEDKKNEKSKSEKLWTSIGFAAGGFNSYNPSVSQTPSTSTLFNAQTNSAATKQSKASGVAYSMGFSFGTKLSNRWVLQGGINYLTQSSDYTATSVVVDNNFQSPQAESLNAYDFKQAKVANAPTQKVAQTFPYTVNNNVQFVSVPVQAGYLIVNKKLGLQVNAGVSTDLFLQNTITPEGGGISKLTQGRGEDSPYRSLNFSGLMGTELSYKLGYRYRISLNPGLRYPFNSVYKSDTGVQATPVTFDVGLRFRYIFH